MKQICLVTTQPNTNINQYSHDLGYKQLGGDLGLASKRRWYLSSTYNQLYKHVQNLGNKYACGKSDVLLEIPF